MYLARPSFRPWRILFALISAYVASGFLYVLASVLAGAAEYLFAHGLPEAFDLVLGSCMAFLVGAWIGLLTLLNLGFPIVDPDTNERANLYPVIVPIALLFLALAMQAVRFGRKSPQASAESGALVPSADPVDPERER